MRKRVTVLFVAALVSIFGTVACGGGGGGDQQLQELVDKRVDQLQEQVDQLQEQVDQLQEQVDQMQGGQTGGEETTIGQ